MQRLILLAVAALLPLYFAGAAAASNLDVSIVDAGGKPVASAVLSLAVPPNAPPAPPLPAQAVINQKFETFFPLVSILPVGGNVIFRNSDKTMHQVYSFSAIKRFAFEVDIGQTSPEVAFDKAGIAAIGCNIHDQMITYVVVTDNPYTKLSGDDGVVHFGGLVPGHYSVQLWHPDLAPGANPPTAEIDVGDGSAALKLAIKIVPRQMAPMSHMGAY